MVKFPNPGKVNLNLSSHFSEEECAGLYSNYIRDIISAHSNKAYRFFVYLEPFDLSASFLQRFGSVKLYPVDGVNPAQKFLHCFKSICDLYEKVAIINAYVPHLGEESVLEAFISLDNSDVVIGPANNETCYFIGMKKANTIFTDNLTDIPLDIKEILGEIERQKLNYNMMPKMDSLERIEDIKKVYKNIENYELANTRRYLKSLQSKYSDLFV